MLRPKGAHDSVLRDHQSTSFTLLSHEASVLVLRGAYPVSPPTPQFDVVSRRAKASLNLFKQALNTQIFPVPSDDVPWYSAAPEDVRPPPALPFRPRAPAAKDEFERKAQRRATPPTKEEAEEESGSELSRPKSRNGCAGLVRSDPPQLGSRSGPVPASNRTKAVGPTRPTIASKEDGGVQDGPAVMTRQRQQSVRDERMDSAEEELLRGNDRWKKNDEPTIEEHQDDDVPQFTPTTLNRSNKDEKSSTRKPIQWLCGEVLGEGAYGKVFAGLNLATGELMAVKQLKVDKCKDVNLGKQAVSHLEALQGEISLYKTMKHKHIVKYIDTHHDEESGSFFIFLEYVPGGSIQSMLERFGKFDEHLIRLYTRQLLLGLEYLHEKNLVHRDIKGGNVLVDAHGVIKLADFGASKVVEPQDSGPTETMGMKSIRGSIFWMAPEVIKGEGYGRRADIWSVGCTVVEMLTATHPWPGLDNTWSAIFHIAKANSGPPVPRAGSACVKEFLKLCFSTNPKHRPTASQLLAHPFIEGPG